MSNMRTIIGYTAGIASFCPHCAIGLFGPEIEEEEIKVLDGDGNLVRPVFAGSQWTSCHLCAGIELLLSPVDMMAAPVDTDNNDED